MVNGLYSLLHGVVVVVAIGAAVTPVTTTTSQSRAVISQPPPSSNNNLESSGVQVGTTKAEVIAERSSVPSHDDVVGDFNLLEETGAADNGYDREASRKNHTDLCGTTTTGARHSRFCPVNNSNSSTKNLRGQRTNHRTKGKGVELKSPDVEDGRKKKKRFLRWAGDEEGKGGDSKRANEASVEGAVVVDAAGSVAKALRGRGGSNDALDGVPSAQESNPARFGHGDGSRKSFRGGKGGN